MAAVKPNGKRSLIDKANSSMVITIAVAGFLIVFSLVASKALLSQRSYQAKVITEKKKAADQLSANVVAVDKLAISYKEFVGTPDNVLGGNPSGTGDRDGNNAKIVLDALPSKYDFPAFVTSIQKLLNTKGVVASSITGTDDEVTQSGDSTKKPVEIPFELAAEVPSYAKVQDFLLALEKSIRPIKLKTLELTGSEKQITVNVDAVSYYQAEKSLTVEKKAVK